MWTEKRDGIQGDLSERLLSPSWRLDILIEEANRASGTERLEKGRTLRFRYRTLALILLVSLVPVFASSIMDAHAQDAISVSSGQSTVTLSIHILFSENATALSKGSVVWDSTNSSQLVSSFQTAMQRLVSRVTIDASTFRLAASVRQRSQNSSTWIVSENLTLNVDGVASNKPGRASYDLSFIAMNMSDSLRSGGVEFNAIGSAYLVDPINAQSSNTVFYLDRSLFRGGPYLNPVIPTLTTQRFNILDFSWIPSLDLWDNTYKPLASVSTFGLVPGKDRPGLPYNLTFGVKSPEGVIIVPRVAFYNLDLNLTAPPRAVAHGSVITFNISSSTDFLIPTIIGATIVVSAVSFVAEKRLVKSSAQFRKKRK